MPRNEILLRPSTVAKLNEPTLFTYAGPVIPEWIVPVKKIFWMSRTRVLQWCRMAYPRHPKGCPNAYGKCHIEDGSVSAEVIDNSKPKWIVHAEFDLAAHVAKMKKKHPEWTERQARCVLYWQPKSLCLLNERVEQFLEIMRPWRLGYLIFLGESDGVNLWRTARYAGIRLEPIREMKCCRHLALFCFTTNPQGGDDG